MQQNWDAVKFFGMVTLTRFTVREEARCSLGTIDTEEGIIYGVKILGPDSLNERHYTESAMRSAATLYEGAKVNLDHPSRKDHDQERLWSEGIGEIRESRFDRDKNGVFGNLHYLKSHPLAGCLVECAERFPNNFGLSHNADVEGYYDEHNKQVIESVTDVNSVDVVGTPATSKGLFESIEDTNMKKRYKIRQLVESVSVKTFGRKWLLEQMEGENGEQAVVSPDIEVEVEPAATDDDKVKAAFREAVMAAFDDESLDTKATMEKIKQILKAHEQAKAAMGEPAADEAAGDTVVAPAEEVAEVVESLQREVKEMKAEKEVAELLRTEGIEAKPSRVASLVSVKREFRDELLEEYRKTDAPVNGARRPDKSPSKFGDTVLESAPRDADEMLKRL